MPLCGRVWAAWGAREGPGDGGRPNASGRTAPVFAHLRLGEGRWYVNVARARRPGEVCSRLPPRFFSICTDKSAVPGFSMQCSLLVLADNTALVCAPQARRPQLSHVGPTDRGQLRGGCFSAARSRESSHQLPRGDRDQGALRMTGKAGLPDSVAGRRPVRSDRVGRPSMRPSERLVRVTSCSTSRRPPDPATPGSFGRPPAERGLAWGE